jgi:tRNA threonylcarbamoyladenosine biosynthesis protein TsaE
VSPTFNILLIHKGTTDASIDFELHHWDLYRLDHDDELDDLDYFAYTGDGGVISLVEWGDKFDSTRQSADVVITLVRSGDTQRRIELHALSSRGAQLLEQVAFTDAQQVDGA